MSKLETLRKKIEFKLEAKEKDNKTVIYMYGDIVDEEPRDYFTNEPLSGEYIYPAQVRDLVEQAQNDELELHINSYGGSVFASVAIFNFLRNSGKQITTYIDGLAASGASIIAMAGDKIIMPANTQLMIHKASSFGFGNAKALRKAADILETIDKTVVTETYIARFKGTAEELENLLEDETWLSAREAYDYGLCDVLVELDTAPEDEPQAQTQAMTDKEFDNARKFFKNLSTIKF